MRKLRWWLLAASVIYWVWPLDFLPGLPYDDIALLGGALLNVLMQSTQTKTN